MGGMKLWVPPPVVKFGCLMHDEQLSSSASRICRMVAVASIQIAFFVAPVPGPRRWLSMVFLILCTRWCLNVRERRAPVCRSSSSSAQVGLIVLLILVLVSARVEINRVYIYGHPVADSSVGVTGAGSATPRRHQRTRT